MSFRPLSRVAPRDVAIAGAVAGFALVGVAIAPAGRTPLDPLGYALLLGGAFSLVARRRAPVVVLLVTTVCVFGYLVRGYPGVAAALPVMVALLTAVRAGHRLAALAPKGSLVAVAVLDLTVHHGMPVRQVLQDRFLLAGWLVASAGAGMAFRQWDAYVREAARRVAEAERTREETARRRAGEERLRIARELHDSLTHSISIVRVQAGVAVHLARKRGEEPSPALLAIQEAGGEAMRELRATLEVLRDSDGETSAVGLDRLPELVRRARSAGLPVDVAVTGSRWPPPSPVDRAAYRIVQEALTNVARHAGPASATVRIDYHQDRLTVRVDDDGPASDDAAPVPGMGLTGMRERVAALGGRLHTGPRPGGGFTVQAELPRSVPPGHPGSRVEPAGGSAVPDGRAAVPDGGRAGSGSRATAPDRATAEMPEPVADPAVAPPGREGKDLTAAGRGEGAP